MKKLSIAIGLSLGVLATPPGLADSPISFTDAANDVPYPVIDLQEVSVNVTDDTITATLTVGDLPSQLPFYHPDTPDYRFEYLWEVIFDVNGNNVNDRGDIRIGTSIVKFPDASPKQGAILEEGSHEFLEVMDGDTAHTMGNLDIHIDGNTIILSVNKSAYTGLSAITPATPFGFETFYHYGEKIGSDFAPNTDWFFKNDVQPSDPTSQQRYDEGYKAGSEVGLSECKASFSPSDGSVYIPCVNVYTDGRIIRYKVDMKLVPSQEEQLLFSVTGVEEHTEPVQ